MFDIDHNSVDKEADIYILCSSKSPCSSKRTKQLYLANQQCSRRTDHQKNTSPKHTEAVQGSIMTQ